MPPLVVVQSPDALLSRLTTVSGNIWRYTSLSIMFRILRPKVADKSAVWVTIMIW
jgi:hypothetical protein